MIRRILLSLLVLSFPASLALAKQGVVRTKDGRSIEGDINDKGADGASVMTKAGSITIARDDISEISYSANIQEEYEARVKALPKPRTAKDHFGLARWLYEQRAYELARKETDAALALDANFADAVTLRQTIDRQIAWDRTKPAVTDPRPPTTRNVGGGNTTATRGERRTLDPDQINAIRLFELRETDNVRVRFENNVARRYTEYDNVDPRQFNTLPDFRKAIAILTRGTAEMRPDVRILTDPRAIADFKRLQPMLLTGCAATNCHASPAGGFQLLTPADNDAVTYTNFYILSTKTATQGETTRRLIDRVYPSNSLVAQYGLPHDKAEFDHPAVQGWNAVFRDTNDPRYRALTEWIRSGLLPVEPKYDITFTLPGSTTRPAVPAAAADAPAPRQPPANNANAKRPQPQRNPGDPEPGPRDTQGTLKDIRERIRPTGLN
jgi:hypothetical protein